MIETVLDHIRHGWFVFPCKSRGKKPLTPHGFKDATNDPAKARKFWDQFPDANVGIDCGASNLAAIDIDPRNGGSLDGLTRMFGPIPQTATVKTGGGGLHLYFSTNGLKVRCRKLAKGIELKADGGYVIAPPSIHKSGKPYEWTRSPESDPLAPLPAKITEDVIEQTETTETVEQAETAEQAEHGCAVSITRAIEMALPNGPGQRNHCVFRLARILKANPSLAAADSAGLRPIVQEWHRRALSVIRTKPFGETWADFVHAWSRVEFPAGEDVLARAVATANADRSPLPPVVQGYESAAMERLVRLCRTLQRMVGGKEFFLSCATVQRLLGISGQSAWRWLNLLLADGVLVRTKPGTKVRATRYRYVLDDVPESPREPGDGAREDELE